MYPRSGFLYNLDMGAEIKFEPFEQVAALIKDFAGFRDDLRQTLQQSMAQLQESLQQMCRQFAAGMAEYERYANEEEAEVFRVLSQGGWLGMERHFTVLQARSALEICKSKSEVEMNDAIGRYFGANDSARLVAMTEDWSRVRYLCDRQAIVRDAMSAHRAGQFTLSIPALLPLAEGLCAEILGSSSATNVVRAVAQDWNSRDNEVWVQLFHDVVEDVIYRSYTFGKDPAPYLNRHGILHGRVPDYASELNSTRVFLLIDVVADLWHAKLRSPAPLTP
jgi:hypothetical protein